MSASERESEPRQQQPAPPVPMSPSALSMRDLLASCAAASAVSTPPRDERLAGERERRRDAA
ncbi:hypothetical protein OH805_14385 [Streptomyces sp. NBC_00879]|uniref:hypothetical protein n=1 Tax=unclassified Streptomyces TaxID=2593676 RepID=UPI002D774E86|nr:hypothetical protein [Streptomyces sp.]WSY67651.1 hypothetical protein OHA61_14720 [Streptomyces sp. NBC_00885]WSY75231.1 hypothetical protein OH805_14385 [Streptomyces sp. NBC_00879]HET6359983.1 hypothetical protein [Streptomyces sp.]